MKQKVSIINFVFIKMCKTECQTKGEQKKLRKIYLLLIIFFNKSTLTFHFEITLFRDSILVCSFENTWKSKEHIIYDQAKHFIYLELSSRMLLLD